MANKVNRWKVSTRASNGFFYPYMGICAFSHRSLRNATPANHRTEVESRSLSQRRLHVRPKKKRVILIFALFLILLHQNTKNR